MKTIKINKHERAKHLNICPLFNTLTEKDKLSLADFVMLREYPVGEELFRQQTSADGFFIVISGKIKVYRTGNDGRQQVLHLFGKGEMVGEVPVFQGGKYPASASASSKARALYIPADKFLDYGEHNPEVLIEMLAVLSMRLRRFVELVDDLSLKEVSARLAKYLLDKSIQNNSGHISLDTSKTMLASRLGTVPETISRTLNKMQKKNIIKVNGSDITIINPEILTSISSGIKF